MGAGGIPLQVEKGFFEKERGKYKLYAYTADITYESNDRVDVSVNNGQFVFVPPRHLLFDYRFGYITEDQFKKAYFELLEESYVNQRYTWDTILNGDRIVLVCNCNAKGKACHRYFLINFLKKLGVVYKGELEPQKTRRILEPRRSRRKTKTHF